MTTAPSQTNLDLPPVDETTTSTKKHWIERLHNAAWTVFRHAQKHTGVGIVCSVAYFDP